MIPRAIQQVLESIFVLKFIYVELSVERIEKKFYTDKKNNKNFIQKNKLFFLSISIQFVIICFLIFLIIFIPNFIFRIFFLILILFLLL
jgi:hypothetical protein